MRHCFRGKGRFRIRDVLAGIQPIPFPLVEAKLIPTRYSAAVEMDKLAYFAASVVWRAGVHQWVINEHQLNPIDIRADQLEQLRRFLIGETGFPSDTFLWVSVSKSPDPLPVVYPPYGGVHDGHYSFRFQVLGVAFALFMGPFVPPIVPQLCSVRSTDQLIHLTENVEKAAMGHAMELMKTTTPAQSLISPGS